MTPPTTRALISNRQSELLLSHLSLLTNTVRQHHYDPPYRIIITKTAAGTMPIVPVNTGEQHHIIPHARLLTSGQGAQRRPTSGSARHWVRFMPSSLDPC